MEIKVSACLEDSSFLFGERGQRSVGEKIRKVEKISSTKRDRVRPLSNWRFSLISWSPYHLKIFPVPLA